MIEQSPLIVGHHGRQKFPENIWKIYMTILMQDADAMECDIIFTDNKAWYFAYDLSNNISVLLTPLISSYFTFF
jgi:hypothetical protein